MKLLPVAPRAGLAAMAGIACAAMTPAPAIKAWVAVRRVMLLGLFTIFSLVFWRLDKSWTVVRSGFGG
jgi:hypothetical protein